MTPPEIPAPSLAPILAPTPGAVKRRLRAVEYRGRAEAATALADGSPLANVREKHERAAARWAELAELDERENATVRATAARALALAASD